MGFGELAPLWDAFFPGGEEDNLEALLEQLTGLFQQMFAEQSYEQYLNQFTGLTRSLNEYANDPADGTLPDILVNSEEAATGLLSNGWSTASVYLAAALLHIMALKCELEATPDKPGAANNIASAAMETLSSLLVLEEAYGSAQGWQSYFAFKQATITGFLDMPDDAATAFGLGYPAKVQGLMNLVNMYDPDSLEQVTHPPYLMLILLIDPGSTPLTWSSSSADPAPAGVIRMYKHTKLPANVPSNYYVLSDIAYYSDLVSPVPWAVYVAPYDSRMVTATGFTRIYDDHGNNVATGDYAAFIAEPGCIGTYSANSDDATEPDFPNMAVVIDPAHYIQVELGDYLWDDGGTNAHEDCTIYRHPQFGEFGAYNIFRSHDRPSPDTVNGLPWSALTGHAVYNRNYVPPTP